MIRIVDSGPQMLVLTQNDVQRINQLLREAAGVRAVMTVCFDEGRLTYWYHPPRFDCVTIRMSVQWIFKTLEDDKIRRRLRDVLDHELEDRGFSLQMEVE